MFHKSKGKTILCIKVTKDEKGKGNIPEDRYDNLHVAFGISLLISHKGVK